MDFRSALEFRTAEAYPGGNDHQGRVVLILFGSLDGRGNSIQIISIINRVNGPAVRLEPFSNVFSEGNIGVALNRNAIVVIEIDQLPQPQRSCKRCSFRGYPLPSSHHRWRCHK